MLIWISHFNKVLPLLVLVTPHITKYQTRNKATILMRNRNKINQSKEFSFNATILKQIRNSISIPTAGENFYM